MKVCVLGLDGATWDLLLPWVREGFLPTLKKLMESGTYGELESTIPPLTGPAWASFATGKNPGKTGIFNFLLPRRSLDDLAPTTSRDIDGKTFYETLDENGRVTIMINLPMSYPPRTKNPTITSIMTQGDNFVFPESLRETIPELEEYRLVPDFALKTKGRHREYIQDIRKLEETRFKCAQKLFEREWDLFFLLFSGTDWVQHELYDKLISGSLDQTHPALQLYRDIDGYIQWFVRHSPDDTVFLLMSDHGFSVYEGTFHVNQWLREKGFLRLSSSGSRAHPYQHRFVEELDKAQSRNKMLFSLPGSLAQFLRRLGFEKMYRTIEKYIPVRIHTQMAVDYTKTYAFCPTFELSGIYLNLVSRFENGIVETKDAGRLKNEIISQLKRLKNPATGEDAFCNVLDSQEVYSGGKMKFAPDILIVPSNFFVTHGLFVKNMFNKNPINFHSASGIFLAYGRGVKSGQRISGAKIYDIAPTILHTFDIPIPEDIDGRVLKEVFSEDSRFAQRPIKYQGLDH